MDNMNKTIGYYDKNASAFVKDTLSADMKEILGKFIKILSDGSKILDAGCGSGRDSLYFIEKGFDVVAIDGSEEMCKVASVKTGKTVECILFENILYDNEFDGIWACASLLHIERQKQRDVWNKLVKSLKQNGKIYASYKLGDYFGVRNGRYYSDMNKNELEELLKNVGIKIIDIWESSDVRPLNNTKWINVIASKD